MPIDDTPDLENSLVQPVAHDPGIPEPTKEVEGSSDTMTNGPESYTEEEKASLAKLGIDIPSAADHVDEVESLKKTDPRFSQTPEQLANDSSFSPSDFYSEYLDTPLAPDALNLAGTVQQWKNKAPIQDKILGAASVGAKALGAIPQALAGLPQGLWNGLVKPAYTVAKDTALTGGGAAIDFARGIAEPNGKLQDEILAQHPNETDPDNLKLMARSREAAAIGSSLNDAYEQTAQGISNAWGNMTGASRGDIMQGIASDAILKKQAAKDVQGLPNTTNPDLVTPDQAVRNATEEATRPDQENVTNTSAAIDPKYWLAGGIASKVGESALAQGLVKGLGENIAPVGKIIPDYVKPAWVDKVANIVGHVGGFAGLKAAEAVGVPGFVGEGLGFAAGESAGNAAVQVGTKAMMQGVPAVWNGTRWVVSKALTSAPGTIAATGAGAALGGLSLLGDGSDDQKAQDIANGATLGAGAHLGSKLFKEGIPAVGQAAGDLAKNVKGAYRRWNAAKNTWEYAGPEPEGGMDAKDVTPKPDPLQLEEGNPPEAAPVAETPTNSNVPDAEITGGWPTKDAPLPVKTPRTTDAQFTPISTRQLMGIGQVMENIPHIAQSIVADNPIEPPYGTNPDLDAVHSRGLALANSQAQINNHAARIILGNNAQVFLVPHTDMPAVTQSIFGQPHNVDGFHLSADHPANTSGVPQIFQAVRADGSVPAQTHEVGHFLDDDIAAHDPEGHAELKSHQEADSAGTKKVRKALEQRRDIYGDPSHPETVNPSVPATWHVPDETVAREYRAEALSHLVGGDPHTFNSHPAAEKIAGSLMDRIGYPSDVNTPVSTWGVKPAAVSARLFKKFWERRYNAPEPASEPIPNVHKGGENEQPPKDEGGQAKPLSPKGPVSPRGNNPPPSEITHGPSPYTEPVKSPEIDTVKGQIAALEKTIASTNAATAGLRKASDIRILNRLKDRLAELEGGQGNVTVEAAPKPAEVGRPEPKSKPQPLAAPSAPPIRPETGVAPKGSSLAPRMQRKPGGPDGGEIPIPRVDASGNPVMGGKLDPEHDKATIERIVSELPEHEQSRVRDLLHTFSDHTNGLKTVQYSSAEHPQGVPVTDETRGFYQRLADLGVINRTAVPKAVHVTGFHSQDVHEPILDPARRASAFEQARAAVREDFPATKSGKPHKTGEKLLKSLATVEEALKSGKALPTTPEFVADYEAAMRKLPTEVKHRGYFGTYDLSKVDTNLAKLRAHFTQLAAADPKWKPYADYLNNDKRVIADMKARVYNQNLGATSGGEALVKPGEENGIISPKRELAKTEPLIGNPSTFINAAGHLPAKERLNLLNMLEGPALKESHIPEAILNQQRTLEDIKTKGMNPLAQEFDAAMKGINPEYKGHARDLEQAIQTLRVDRIHGIGDAEGKPRFLPSKPGHHGANFQATTEGEGQNPNRPTDTLSEIRNLGFRMEAGEKVDLSPDDAKRFMKELGVNSPKRVLELARVYANNASVRNPFVKFMATHDDPHEAEKQIVAQHMNLAKHSGDPVDYAEWMRDFKNLLKSKQNHLLPKSNTVNLNNEKTVPSISGGVSDQGATGSNLGERDPGLPLSRRIIEGSDSDLRRLLRPSGKADPHYFGIRFGSPEKVALSDQQENEMRHNAMRMGKYVNPKDLASFIRGLKLQPGSEHNAYQFTMDGKSYHLKTTQNGKYGLEGRTPEEYLDRLYQQNRVVPERLLTRFVAVTDAPAIGHVIITVQNTSKGLGNPKYVTGPQLNEAMKANGWEKINQGGSWKHTKTGLEMHDVHVGNVFINPDGSLDPIDVGFTNIPDNLDKEALWSAPVKAGPVTPKPVFLPKP